MTAPIDMALNAFPWEVVENPDKGDGTLPYVTAHGVLNLAGLSLRCYQLSDGHRVFDSDDLRPLIEALGIEVA